MDDKDSRIHGKMSVLQAPRYYDLPNKSDDWEIERRFVSIDYGSKLGEGAFGSVFLGEHLLVHKETIYVTGRVLAKNIPIGIGRSIAELYALTNNNETVAVKMLHGSYIILYISDNFMVEFQKLPIVWLSAISAPKLI